MQRPIGIDLGTTYSAVACVDEHGKARVLADAEGKFLIPSVVLFEDDGVVVGEIAKDSAVASPDRVVACIKRYMGEPSFEFECDGVSYTPEMISAEILKELKAVAEANLGPVTEAVITVPAYFLDGERTATKRAAEMAGLNVLKIINEPTAAALAYGIEEDQSDATFLVYDLGGGTFDVTVMKARGGADFEMVTTQGNHRLGGHDWDAKIRDHVAELFAEKYDRDPRDDLVADHDLFVKAEHAKIALSQVAETRIVCQHAGQSLTVELKRPQFEELTEDLLNLTAIEVEAAMSSAGLTPEQIDMVLLVGGSTKMPMVANLMKTKARQLKTSRNPDHCVAMGAALQAAIIASKDQKRDASGLYKPTVIKRLGEAKVLDRTPHALGMIAVKGGQLANTIIIPKGTTVPCERHRDDYTTTADNQDTLTVHLVQGEAEDPEACVPLASYDFKGIPPRPAGRGRIRVSYRYSSDTIVDVSATDLESGKELILEKRPLVDLGALVERKPPRRRVVALLVDSSGSMSGLSLVEAQRACNEFIEKTNFELVEMGLVQFGMMGRASVLQGLCREPRRLSSAVGQLHADGGTPMAQAIEIGTQMVTRDAAETDRFLVLFTDGAPDDSYRAIQAAATAKESGIKVICVGVPGADRQLLGQLASCSEDSLFAEGGDQLVDTFGNIAQLISQKTL